MPMDDGDQTPEVYSPDTHETWFGRWCIRREFGNQLRAWAGKDYVPMERGGDTDVPKTSPPEVRKVSHAVVHLMGGQELAYPNGVMNITVDWLTVFLNGSPAAHFAQHRVDRAYYEYR